MTTIDATGLPTDSRLEVHVGDTIVIPLPDNPTTGYRWELAPLDGDDLVLEESTFQPAGAGVGGGGTAVWTLRAVDVGISDVKARRWRPWEGESSIIDHYRIRVVVRDVPQPAQ